MEYMAGTFDTMKAPIMSRAIERCISAGGGMACL